VHGGVWLLPLCTKEPHIEQETDDGSTKQTQKLVMICEQYPPEALTNVCTHGSPHNVMQDIGWYCHLIA